MLDGPDVYIYNPKPRYMHGQSSEHVDIGGLEDVADQLPGVAIERLAFLQAWDPVAGKEVWRVTLDSEYSGSGVLSTAGNLVFQGSGDGFLYIYMRPRPARGLPASMWEPA
jgi:hypothetical protein